MPYWGIQILTLALRKNGEIRALLDINKKFRRRNSGSMVAVWRIQRKSRPENRMMLESSPAFCRTKGFPSVEIIDRSDRYMISFATMYLMLGNETTNWP